MSRATGTELAALLSGTSEEVLARLLVDDPLALRARLAAQLERGALLVDAEHAFLRCATLVALRAPESRGTAREEFLARCLADGLRAVLEEEEDATEAPLEPFARPLGLDARRLAEACRRFNRQPPEVREAFIAAVLRDEPFERAARARRLSLPEFAQRARTGLELFRGAGGGR